MFLIFGYHPLPRHHALWMEESYNILIVLSLTKDSFTPPKVTGECLIFKYFYQFCLSLSRLQYTLTLEEHSVNQSYPRRCNSLRLSIFNSNISAATIRKHLERGPLAVFSLLIKLKKRLFLSFKLSVLPVLFQLHEANSDFRGCLILPTLHYIALMISAFIS